MVDNDNFNSFKDFKYRKELIPKVFSEQEKFFSNLAEDFYQQLKDSEAAKAFFDRFHKLSDPDHFLRIYSRKKTELIRYYEYYLRILNREELDQLEYQERAELALSMILQKKLFNLQLKWRANQLQIENLEITADFDYWERNIFNCPFIPLVSSYEVDLLIEFLFKLDKAEIERAFDFTDWQDYSDLMEKDEYGDYSNMPEWYKFYDNRTGTGGLLLLPDLRGVLENKYINLAQQYRQKQMSPASTSQIQIDSRPFLFELEQPLIDFSRTVETDKHIKELFNCLELDIQSREKEPDEEELANALDILKTADRPIYFDSHLVWHEAIFSAATNYETQRITENIHFVYQNYLMMKELGMSFTRGKDHGILKTMERMREMDLELILQGRELSGEPLDLNF